MAIITRKNIEKLTNAEWNRFAAALNEYKASGEYDTLTVHHGQAMFTPVLMPGESPITTQRNSAHAGPAFFPWHRQYLRELELKLVAIQATLFPFSKPVGIPYWRWNVSGANWRTAPVWSRMGGNGDSSNGNRVTSGPFAHWNSVVYNNQTGTFVPRAGIIRDFIPDSWAAMPTWGSRSNSVYDASPWDEKSQTGVTWRNDFENIHNTVHWLIGGDMGTATSPNDPIFFLHHCNVDRAWAWWQAQHGVTAFQPNGEGPFRHNRLEAPLYLDSSAGDNPKQINGMLDRLNFDAVGSGFTYDTINP